MVKRFIIEVKDEVMQKIAFFIMAWTYKELCLLYFKGFYEKKSNIWFNIDENMHEQVAKVMEIYIWRKK